MDKKLYKKVEMSREKFRFLEVAGIRR